MQSVAPPARCVASCEAGLTAAAETFQWLREDGSCVSLRDAMDAPGRALSTEIVRGGGGENGADTAKGADAMTIERERERLFGDAAIARARGWAEDGCVEPDVVDALESLRARSDDWAGADLGDTLFALLGGTSELCPLVPLLRLGAHVAVVAREGAKLEEAVSEAARSETGTLYVPLTETNSSNSGVRRGADLAGARRRFARGCRFSPPGRFHASSSARTRTRTARRTSARLWRRTSCSPVYTKPSGRRASRRRSCRRRGRRSRFRAGVAPRQGPRTRRRGERGRVPLAEAGGPCLAAGSRQTAARLWRERASILQIEGCPRRLSSRTCTTDTSFCRVRLRARQNAANGARSRARERRGDEREHGPGSRTKSMRHVKAVAIALEGQKHFPPLRPFDADETRETMASPRAPRLGRGPRREAPARAAPTKKSDEKNAHPMDVFGRHAVHGGTWRCPWSVDSIGRASVSRGRCGVERVSASRA